jgi:pimeloyl-ACP methyl ester carboxylesterase
MNAAASEQWSRLIRSRDGVLVSVSDAQNATDLPCVLIHGFGEGGYVWNRTRVVLSSLCRPVVIDLRGHGDSGHSADGHYDIHSHIRDVTDVIETLGIRRMALLGHSMGGRVAAGIARDLAGRVVALGIVDITPEPNPDAIAQMIAHLRESLRPYASHAEYASWLATKRQLLPISAIEELAQASLRSTDTGFELKLDPRLLESETLEAMRAEDAWFARVLHEVDCPTTLFRGMGSAFTHSAAAQRMVRSLRQGTLVTIPNAGHATMTDNPQQFHSAICRWIAEC